MHKLSMMPGAIRYFLNTLPKTSGFESSSPRFAFLTPECQEGRSSMDLNKAILYGQLVKAAYDVPTTDLTNKVGMKVDAGLGANKTTYEVIASVFANDLATDKKTPDMVKPVSIGLILWQAGTGEGVISIRGTEGISEWVEDAKFDTKRCFFLPEAGETEDGFTDVYRSFEVGSVGSKQPVTSSLATVFDSRAVKSLTICGHSLGGALATLQGLDVAANTNFKDPTVYTYASPRTGTTQFADVYNAKVPNTFRIANKVDLVPKLPLFPPYEHVQGEFKLSGVQVFPPAVLVEPNVVCEHVLETYLHLLSKLAGGDVLPLRQGCEAKSLTQIADYLKMEARSVENLIDDVRQLHAQKSGD